MKLKSLAQGLVIAGLASHVLAQEAQRVEITGSSIKRIQAEGALPVQVIKAADLEKQGISTVEQLVQSISAAGNGLDNLATNQGGDFLNSLLLTGKSTNNGASGISLRGFGSGDTLVLLNGRRVATHGSSGKSADLNSIPLSALDRVEILKDGASAIYGTDAIGGVINFILKREYTGLEVSGFADATQNGGGDKVKANVLYGVGALDRDGYNFMVSLGVDSNSRLRGSQRSFHNGYQPERGLAPDTTGTPYANVAAASGTAYATARQIPGFPTVGSGYNRINLLALQGNCNLIENQYIYRGDVTGFPRSNAACVYDYGKDWSLMQPVDRTNLVSRAAFALSKDHTLTLELLASRVQTSAEYTPNQFTNAARGTYPRFQRNLTINPDGTFALSNALDTAGNRVSAPYYPFALANAINALVPGAFTTTPTNAALTNANVRVRWRCVACGPRQQDNTTDANRLFAGMEGVLGDWDYKWGLSNSQSKSDTEFGGGNFYAGRIAAVMQTGLVNPFLLPGQSQTAQALSLIDFASAKGQSLYGGKSTSREADVTFSNASLMKFGAGSLGGAFGASLRREGFEFSDGTATALDTVIGAGSPAALDKVSRNIKAVFAELAIPIVKDLDAQLAVRHDSYSDFGGTTNPKAALRWQASNNLLFRGSYSRGFRAPDFNSLYAGLDDRGGFNSDIDDPLTCTATNTDGCAIRPGINIQSNPNLKPEKSKQWSVGMVFSPTDWLSGSIDYWNTNLSDRIRLIPPSEIVRNPAKYAALIIRDGDGVVDTVIAPWTNVATDIAKGLDLNLTATAKTGLGKVTGTVDGTYFQSYKTQLVPGGPFSERVGEFGDVEYGYDLKVRWKHTASVSLAKGDWTTTLTQFYTSSYKSEKYGFGTGVIPAGQPSKIKSYILYNLTASFSATKNTTLTGGIINLLNTDPPFSAHNVDNVAGAGWDARVGDPRGRALTVKLTHKFF